MADDSASSTGTSTQQFLTSLIINGVLFIVFVTLFLILRLKYKRIYEPRTFLDSVPDDVKPEHVSSNPIVWVKTLLSRSETTVLKQAGIDGYFYLRYLKLVSACSAVGVFVLFPILFAINATGGAGQDGLNILSFSNILNSDRYFANVFLGWIFFGFIEFVLYRELVYFTSFRQAVLTSPAYASDLSSRTILFQTIPSELSNESAMKALFPTARNVWIARSQKTLAKKVAKRTKLAMKLEGAETALLKKAVKAKKKADKKGIPIEPADELVCYVPENKRPSHRTFPIFGQKVDTINYCLEKIAELDAEIQDLQATADEAPSYNSVFISFESQEEAEVALQTVAHHKPLHMSPRFIGIAPESIFWPNLRMLWSERLVRRVAGTAAAVALVIFWAIPVAFVGVISNLTYLTNKLPWLDFIYNLPEQLLGIITALLPTVLLAVLMMLLPIFLRIFAKIGGQPSVVLVQYEVQNSYFMFQVIQVFLVTTLTSAAASVVTQIIQNPSSVLRVLSDNLPKASNFFIAYILLQALTVSGGMLLQITGLILFYVLGKLLDSTARKKYTRFTSLGSNDYGTLFPVYTNLFVIVLSYSLISPLILIFSAIGFLILYLAYLYQMTYVTDFNLEARGRFYPRAIYQTFTGLYLAQLCLIGLFAVSKAWGPLVLQAIFLGFTAFFQTSLQKAMDPLLYYLPRDIMRDRSREPHTTSLVNQSKIEIAGSSQQNTDDDIPLDELTKEGEKSHNSSFLPTPGGPDGPTVPPANAFVRFFKPHLYLSYTEVLKMIPESYQFEKVYSEEEEIHYYDYPDVTARVPHLWIPRDPMGLSTQEIEKAKEIIPISDEGVELTPDGDIVWTDGPPE